jgi:CubicO group peptidase (beta-lactamase class C family)
MPFFQTNGVAAAAGFSSSALDLARFAQWQFRLLQGGAKELLKPSTLKEMQRVQWINPDGKTTWGLGFVVDDDGGTRVVGHDGSCPGYRTVVIIEPKSKWGAVVMVNAAGIDPWDYAARIMKIMRQYEAQKSFTTASPRKLSDYAGLYNGMDWGSETVYLPWKGHLVSMYFPTGDPTGNAPRLLAPTSVPDQFRMVRTDDLPGQLVEFERNASGQVTRVLVNKNATEKVR